MVRLARTLCRGGASRAWRGSRGLRRGGLRSRRRSAALGLLELPGRTESTGRPTVATWRVRRAVGLGGRRATGHRAGLRAHERADVLRGVLQERHVARALERRGEHPLVLRARAALAARVDLAAVADVATDAADLFEVDLLDLVHAEGADLAARAARSAIAGTVTTAVIATAIARPAARAAAVTTRTGTILTHLVSFVRTGSRPDRTFRRHPVAVVRPASRRRPSRPRARFGGRGAGSRCS